LREDTKVLSHPDFKVRNLLSNVYIFDDADRSLALRALYEGGLVRQPGDCNFLKLKTRSIAMWAVGHFSLAVLRNAALG
jgi:hypothetical protein